MCFSASVLHTVSGYGLFVHGIFKRVDKIYVATFNTFTAIRFFWPSVQFTLHIYGQSCVRKVLCSRFAATRADNIKSVITCALRPQIPPRSNQYRKINIHCVTKTISRNKLNSTRSSRDISSKNTIALSNNSNTHDSKVR